MLTAHRARSQFNTYTNIDSWERFSDCTPDCDYYSCMHSTSQHWHTHIDIPIHTERERARSVNGFTLSPVNKTVSVLFERSWRVELTCARPLVFRYVVQLTRTIKIERSEKTEERIKKQLPRKQSVNIYLLPHCISHIKPRLRNTKHKETVYSCVTVCFSLSRRTLFSFNFECFNGKCARTQIIYINSNTIIIFRAEEFFVWIWKRKYTVELCIEKLL